MVCLKSCFLLFLCFVENYALRILNPTHLLNKTEIDQGFEQGPVNISVFDYTYRLPRTYEAEKPITYELHVDIDASKDFVDGIVNISIFTRQVDNLVLHAHPKYISIKDGSIFSNGAKQRLTNPKFNKTRLTVTYKLEKSISGICKIQIQFRTKVNLPPLRFFPLGFNKVEKKSGPRYVTFFEMLGARRMFPCLDETRFKAVFEISVTIHRFEPNVRVISNTMGSNNGKTWKFAPTLKMSTYLLIIAVGAYKPKCLKDGPTQMCGAQLGRGQSTEVCHWLSPEYQNSKIESAVEQMNNHSAVYYCRLLRYLTQQSPAQLHFLLNDVFDGGLEDWGTILISQLDDPTLYAHEITHYWFGDLVTPKAWSNLWLSEGFATFFTQFTNITIMRTAEEILSNVNNEFAAIKMYDRPDAGSIINDKWWNDYGGTPGLMMYSYSKAGLVIFMLYQVVGEECFQYALRNYMKEMAFNSATEHDLLRHFKEAIHKFKIPGWRKGDLLDVEASLHPFLYQGGIPKIEIKNLSDHEVQITKSVPKGQQAYKWPLPIWAYDTTKKKSKLYWSVKPKQTFKVNVKKTEWNKKNFGYYSISYANV